MIRLCLHLTPIPGSKFSRPCERQARKPLGCCEEHENRCGAALPAEPAWKRRTRWRKDWADKLRAAEVAAR